MNQEPARTDNEIEIMAEYDDQGGRGTANLFLEINTKEDVDEVILYRDERIIKTWKVGGVHLHYDHLAPPYSFNYYVEVIKDGIKTSSHKVGVLVPYRCKL